MCLFQRRSDRSLTWVSIDPQGSLGSTMRGLTLSCRYYAIDRGCQRWAQPDVTAPEGEAWLIYEVVDRGAKFRQRLVGSREAVEMYMLHLGFGDA